jgi:NADH-quinone oxidoreductase subunit J
LTELFLSIVIIMIVAGGLMAVGLKNVFHNVLGMAIALFGVSGVFLLLNSELVALMEVLIYVGGISIAIVFAIMLSNPLAEKPAPRSSAKITGAAVVAALVFVSLLWVVMNSQFQPPAATERDWSVKHVGSLLLTEYVLVFELISLVLLVAIIGAILITQKERKKQR